MRSLDKKIVIWGIWLLGLMIILMYFILQCIQNGQTDRATLIKEALTGGICYLFLTLFYVIILVKKQYSKLIDLGQVDALTICYILHLSGYFHHVPACFENIGLFMLGILLLKCIVLFGQKRHIYS